MLVSALSLSALLLSGCQSTLPLARLLPTGHDVQTVELIQTLGIDVSEDGKLVVTGSGASGTEGDTPQLLTGTGTTLSAALLELQTQSDHYVSYGHVEGYLIGEEAAKQGIADLVDLLERDTELRLSTDLYLVRGGTAGELMEQSSGGDSSISQRLEAMALDSTLLLDLEPYTLKDLLIDLEEGAALVPAISMGEEEAQRDGYACFRGDALVGWLEEKEARGVCLLRGQVEGASISLTLPDGSEAALRLEQGDCQWQPEFQGDTLKKLTGNLTVTAAVAELRGGLDLSTSAGWEELETALAKQIWQEGSNILTKSQAWSADFLRLSQKVALAQSADHTRIEARWGDWFPELELELVVTCQVDRTYDIENSLLAQEGGGA
jgi:spore germination protein KC